ncbi:hypothetical protein EZV62_021925 [Acer yangbiense]|uniref:Reverse transcriptase Ty1/copia-type domain-containing protein n=1 Tax=Acer yangbiense TaxID=1000413 RepID=A0A5C7H9E1_9ROSI|nr:hypothetical protein EZV62_021925 [Acer yangbiense]
MSHINNAIQNMVVALPIWTLEFQWVKNPAAEKDGEGTSCNSASFKDDLIFTRNNEAMFVEFKKPMMDEFDMTDLGKMRYFLGIEEVQSVVGIFIGQKKYTEEILERFRMSNCNPVQNPIVPVFKLTRDAKKVRVDSTHYKQIVGSLMYLSTRPDMMYVISLINKFIKSLTELHV